MRSHNVWIVDPPSGWKYGFPCELKPGEDYSELLRRKGYPEKDIEFALKYSRQWSEPVLLTVKIKYLDGTEDMKECHDVSELCLDNVDTIKVIRKEDDADTTHPRKNSGKNDMG